MTGPPFIAGRWVASAYSGWLGWTAWALSADTMKLWAMAWARFLPKAAHIRSATSARNVPSAPCLVRLPTSSLSSSANTGTLAASSASIKPRKQP